MEMTGSFTPVHDTIDYKTDLCYKQFGLRHGTFNHNGEFTSYKFRNAIQNRRDFVKHFDDTLLLSLEGWEFSYLVALWPKIQEMGVTSNFSYNPKFYIEKQIKEDKVLELTVIGQFIKGEWYPKLFKGKDMRRPGYGVNLSPVEIKFNSHDDHDDMKNILAEWKKINTTPVNKLKPLEMTLGSGNPLSNDSVPMTAEDDQENDQLRWDLQQEFSLDGITTGDAMAGQSFGKAPKRSPKKKSPKKACAAPKKKPYTKKGKKDDSTPKQNKWAKKLVMTDDLQDSQLPVTPEKHAISDSDADAEDEIE